MSKKHQYLCLEKSTGEFFVTTEKCSNPEDAQQYIGENIVLRPITGDACNPFVFWECGECLHFEFNEDDPNNEYFGVCVSRDCPCCDCIVPKVSFGCPFFEPKKQKEQ